MSRSPFELSFDDLIAAGAAASAAAVAEAERAGVPVAALEVRDAQPDLSWNDVRVARLKALWLDGQTASQIAAALGGVTGKAVQSKIRRVGLAGQRASTAASLDPAQGGQVLTLGAHMCKWPIGDPSSDGFTFCGRHAVDESPYCAEHGRIAYQPQQAKKKGAAPANVVLVEPRRRPGAWTALRLDDRRTERVGKYHADGPTSSGRRRSGPLHQSR
jgi:GcrA cell cycle regulator